MVEVLLTWSSGLGGPSPNAGRSLIKRLVKSAELAFVPSSSSIQYFLSYPLSAAASTSLYEFERRSNLGYCGIYLT